jgi:MrfA Zn-binding domain/Druantia protein DruA
MKHKKTPIFAAFGPEANIKRKIRRHLKKLGFNRGKNGALEPPSSSKESVRALHHEQRKEILKAEQRFLIGALPNLRKHFANGHEIDPSKVKPRLELIRADTWQSDLFRLASLTWSVPVSAGFGRLIVNACKSESEIKRDKAITELPDRRTSDLPDLNELTDHLSYVITPDRRLVIVNKGQVEDERFQGFWICERCGRSETEEPPAGAHRRPYDIEFAHGQHRAPNRCSGEFRNVFLGHVFRTDLLLLRISAEAPIVRDTANAVALRTLEDALYSTAEALRLSASRHHQLDLDPSEFGSGFRIVPVEDEDELFLDVYLYDTLSGGAGYAELAGRHLREILESTLALLEGCHCERSCESCLQHYHNQHLKERLDRRLGAELLRYALYGQPPREPSAEMQIRALAGLRRLLELDGFTCEEGANINRVTVPLLVSKGGRQLGVGVRSGLLDENWGGHTLTSMTGGQGIRTRVLNDYVLKRNLPDEHQLIREAL